MKRVLFISSLYYPHIGGIETMITELSHFCHKDNFYTKVLTKRWPFTLPEYDKYKGIEIYRVVSARDKEDFKVDWFVKTRKFGLIDIIDEVLKLVDRLCFGSQNILELARGRSASYETFCCCKSQSIRRVHLWPL